MLWLCNSETIIAKKIWNNDIIFVKYNLTMYIENKKFGVIIVYKLTDETKKHLNDIFMLKLGVNYECFEKLDLDE